MAQTTIRFRIRTYGRVEELVEGLQGSGCEQLTERIEQQLGSLQQRRSTSEAYQAAAQAVSTPLSVQQRSA